MKKKLFLMLFISAFLINNDVSALETINLDKKIIYDKNPDKSLTVIKHCEVNCDITMIVEWKNYPYIKSYDLLGVKLIDSQIVNILRSYMLVDSKQYNFIEMQKDNFGLNVIYKIPYSGNNIKIILEFRVTKNGNVVMSYQHAKKNIDLNSSKRYKMSYLGYGGVFYFDESIKKYYDGMSGIILNLD